MKYEVRYISGKSIQRKAYYLFKIMEFIRSSRLQVFLKKDDLKNFANFT